MVQGGHGRAAGGRHWAGDLHHCGRLLLIHTVVDKKVTVVAQSFGFAVGGSRFVPPESVGTFSSILEFKLLFLETGGAQL